MIHDRNFSDAIVSRITGFGALALDPFNDITRDRDFLSLYHVLFEHPGLVPAPHYIDMAHTFPMPLYPLLSLSENTRNDVVDELRSNDRLLYEFVNFGIIPIGETKVCCIGWDLIAQQYALHNDTFWALPEFFAPIFKQAFAGKDINCRFPLGGDDYGRPRLDQDALRHIEQQEVQRVFNIYADLPETPYIIECADVDNTFVLKSGLMIRGNISGWYLVQVAKGQFLADEETAKLIDRFRSRDLTRPKVIFLSGRNALAVSENSGNREIGSWKDVVSHVKARTNTSVAEASKSDSTKSRFLLRYLYECLRRGGSDLHFNANVVDCMVVVRCRVNGELIFLDPLTHAEYRTLLSALLPQGAHVADTMEMKYPFYTEGREINCRVEIIPAAEAGNPPTMVIRLLDSSSLPDRLEKLGWTDEEVRLWRNALQKSYGMIICCGPTGSGKTTTLYGALNEINTVNRNIIAIEDPREYLLHGITSLEVNAERGLTFANHLKSTLRADPDVIMIGEIRDAEVAQTAYRAAISGHLVLTTIHADDTVGALMRMHDLGVSFENLADSLLLVNAQRLVRTKCTNCQGRSGGCPACTYTGVGGRTSIVEILPFANQAIRDFLLDWNGNGVGNLRRFLRGEAGIPSLRAKAEQRAKLMPIVEGDIVGLPE